MKTITKIIISILVLSGILLVASCGNSNNTKSVTLQTINGKTYTSNNLKGKWLVINYWASWCKPCYTEIPELNKFAKDYASKADVFGVSYDRGDDQQIEQIITKMGIKFPTLEIDPASDLGLGPIKGLPVTFVINPQGKVVDALYGAQTEASLAQAIGA